MVTPDYFFAHLGEEAIKNVHNIQTSIDSLAESRRKYLRHLPMTGVFVGAVHKVHGSYRGVILQSSQTHAFVYALDFGFTEEVKYTDLFLLTDAMNIPRHPPQASLCKLNGKILFRQPF